MLIWQYKKLMQMGKPENFSGTVLKLDGPVVDGREDYADFLENFGKFLQGIPTGLKIRVFLVKRISSVSFEESKKNPLLTKQIEYLSSKGAYRIGFYYVIEGDRSKVELVSSGLRSCGIDTKEGKGELFEDLAHFFKGTPESPFFAPIEEDFCGIKSGETYGMLYSLVKSPEVIFPFGLFDVLSINRELMLVFSFVKLSAEEAGLKLGKRLKLFEYQAQKGGDISRREVMEDILEQIKDISLGRDAVCACASFLILFGDRKELLKERKKVEFLLHQRELYYECEDTTTIEMFRMLFRYNVKELGSLGLVRYIPQSRLYYLIAPKSFPEGGQNGVILYNSQGEVFRLDIRVPPPNGLVIGQMGSGKSVFLQHFAMYQDYVVFVEKIQEGEGSYTVFTRMMDGGYYPVSLDRPVSLNPFGNSIKTVDVIRFLEDLGFHYTDFTEADLVTLENIVNAHYFNKDYLKVSELLDILKDIKEALYLHSLLSAHRDKVWKVVYDLDRDKLLFIKTLLGMAYKLGKGELIDPAIVEDVIIKTYERLSEGKPSVDREVLMSDFYRTAKEEGFEDLAYRLKTYTLEGAYGQFFDRPSSISLKNYIFFELRTTDSELLPVVLLSILTWMVKWYSSPEMQDKTKGIILDEAWSIIGDPTLVKFVEEAFRTYRKKGIFIMVASQFAKDVAYGPGEIVKKSCPYQIFLYSQEVDEIVRLFEMNPEEEKLLRLIRPPKDYGYKYSVCYMRTPYRRGQERGLFYVLPSREFYWISTTFPQDRVRRENYKNYYGSLAKAIEMLAKEDELSS